MVFGATGRLGAAVVDALLRRPGVAVARIARSGSAPGDKAVLLLDVTDAARRTAHVDAVCRLAASHDRIVLLDAVLDRSSVHAMRTSLHGVADLVVRAADALQRRGHRVRIVAAGTTAVLAPRPYRTPYGLAKRDQLDRYASAGVPGCAALLPMLRAADQSAAPSTSQGARWLAPLTTLPRVVWDYRRAAALLADACTDTGDAFSLTACDDKPTQTEREATGSLAVAHRAAAALAVAPLTIAGWTVGRRSPYTRRLASYARLFVTPSPIRLRVDHHLTPPSRVAALARRLGTPVTWTRS